MEDGDDNNDDEDDFDYKHNNHKNSSYNIHYNITCIEDQNVDLLYPYHPLWRGQYCIILNTYYSIYKKTFIQICLKK